MKTVMQMALEKAGYVVAEKADGMLVATKAEGQATVVYDPGTKATLKPEDIVANVEATHGKVGAKAIARNVAKAYAERKARRR